MEGYVMYLLILSFLFFVFLCNTTHENYTVTIMLNKKSKHYDRLKYSSWIVSTWVDGVRHVASQVKYDGDKMLIRFDTLTKMMLFLGL